MRLSTTILLLLLVLKAVSLSAQSVNGVVSDSVSGETIPGALVLLEETSQSTVTNALGRFSFTGIPAGTYTLRFSFLGYETQSVNIALAANENRSLTVKLHPHAVTLKEVTVQSDANAQPLSVIHHIDRQLRPLNSAQDLLTLVPGLFIAQHAGGGKAEQIFLRGFDCDHGTDFFVSVDGMPVNMVSHAHGQGYADFHFVIPETIDRLEAYKGPYAAKFGDFTTSGAGEFFTKNSIGKSQVNVEAGAFNTFRTVAMIDLLRGKHLFSKQEEHAYLASEYYFTDGYFDSPQHFSRFNLFGKYSGRLNENNLLTFSASTFSSKWNASGQVPERAVQEGLIGRFGGIDPSEGGSTSRSNANLSLLTSLENGDLMRHQLYYSWYRFDLFSNFTFFLHDSVNGDEINQRENGRHLYGYNGSYEHSSRLFGKELKSTLGISTRHDNGELLLRHAVKRMLLDTIVAGKLSEQNLAAYLDETLQLTKKLSVNASVRFDQFWFGFRNYRCDSLSGKARRSILSPKMNLSYNATPSLQWFARAGYGFHSNDARAVVTHTASNILPRAFGYESGVQVKAGKKILLTTALWGLELENELVYVGDEGVVEVSGATRRLGCDFAMRCEITPWLFADLDANYNHGRYRSLPEGENFIPLAPVLTSRGGLTLVREKGLSAGLHYRYVGDRPANESNTVTAKGYFLLDAAATYTWKNFHCGITAENLLNASWNQAQFDTESRLQQEAQPVSELHFTPGTPFFLKMGLGCSF